MRPQVILGYLHLHIGNDSAEPMPMIEKPGADRFPESPVRFPLRFIKELVAGRLLGKSIIRPRIQADVLRCKSYLRRLDRQQDGVWAPLVPAGFAVVDQTQYRTAVAARSAILELVDGADQLCQRVARGNGDLFVDVVERIAAKQPDLEPEIATPAGARVFEIR